MHPFLQLFQLSLSISLSELFMLDTAWYANEPINHAFPSIKKHLASNVLHYWWYPIFKSVNCFYNNPYLLQIISRAESRMRVHTYYPPFSSHKSNFSIEQKLFRASNWVRKHYVFMVIYTNIYLYIILKKRKKKDFLSLSEVWPQETGQNLWTIQTSNIFIFKLFTYKIRLG